MSSFRKFDLNQEPVSLEYIPTGLKGLDQLFGGGLPNNQLVLIEEDEFNTYSSLLLRSLCSYVLHEKAELIYFTDNPPADAMSLIKKLPSRVDGTSLGTLRDMQIAFRYNYMPSLDNDTRYMMDFGRLLDERTCKGRVSEGNIGIYPIKDTVEVLNNYINKLISSIGSDGPQTQQLVVIDHLSACNSLLVDDICPFIYQLKSLARQSSKCSFLVTLQHGWLSNVTIKRLRNISDSSIQLEAFDPLQPSAYSEDYKGALHVHKVTRVSTAKDSLVANLGFQLKKNNRYFLIDKLFLPPDISDTPSRVPIKASNTEEIF